jgi:hypothetical protein
MRRSAYVKRLFRHHVASYIGSQGNFASAVMGALKMQYQIEFLGDADTIVHMTHTEAGSPAIAFQLVVEKGWPPGALTARVIDNYGRCGLAVSKPEAVSGS